MTDKNYYKYHEILFSLRKEYLKNQEIIRKLLSQVIITDSIFDKYSTNLIFKTTAKDKTDSLLLVVSKRQAFIRLLFKSLYDSFVESDHDLEPGKFLYSFRFTDEFIYLLDYCQDGRYLDSKVTINNPKEFIELYRLLMENIICKKGRVALNFEKTFLGFCNNGIHFAINTYKKNISLDYNGIEDNIIASNPTYIKDLMELKVNKEEIPDYFRSLIDRNKDEYLYTIEREENKPQGVYRIENIGQRLVLKLNGK